MTLKHTRITLLYILKVILKHHRQDTHLILVNRITSIMKIQLSHKHDIFVPVTRCCWATL